MLPDYSNLILQIAIESLERFCTSSRFPTLFPSQFCHAFEQQWDTDLHIHYSFLFELNRKAFCGIMMT